MSDRDANVTLEEQIGQWRSYVSRRQAIGEVDVAELEDHLRAQVSALAEAGLDTDEAFLVAVKRMGDLDTLSREFAREHSDRLWKQLVLVPSASEEALTQARREALVAFGLAVIAAVLVKIPALFGLRIGPDAAFYARNASFFVLPVLSGYFIWKRGLNNAIARWLVVAFGVAAVFANVYPFAPNGSTLTLSALHLPIVLWVGAVGVAYAGRRWKEMDGRMDFIRFTGELFIYYVLIALGGGVLTALMGMIFQSVGIAAEPFFQSWLLPCGAAGAVLIASWLVEAKQGVIENMAPVLTRLFTPLFAAVLVAFLGTVLFTGRGVSIQREVLIVFDLLLVVVLALVLYTISARDQLSPPGLFDVLQIVLLVSALAADAVALWAIGARITEFGLTPNRVAALGENVILLLNLGWSAVLYVRFMRGRSSFSAIERWQTAYVPVYAVWALIVVIVFPPLFRFI